MQIPGTAVSSSMSFGLNVLKSHRFLAWSGFALGSVKIVKSIGYFIPNVGRSEKRVLYGGLP